MPRTVEMKTITDALQVTEQNIRQREGRSFPPAIGDRPRVYVLCDVLWWVNGQERTIILQALHIDVKSVQRAVSNVVEAPRYVIPHTGYGDGSEDPLMQ